MTPTEKSRKLFDFQKIVTERYMEYSDSRDVYYDVLVEKLQHYSEARNLLQGAITDSQPLSKDSALIFQMLLDNNEVLSGDAYEDIATSDYDSVASLMPELIAAYYKTDIYDCTDNNFGANVGTIGDKTEALARYFETLAKDIRNKAFEPQV